MKKQVKCPNCGEFTLGLTPSFGANGIETIFDDCTNCGESYDSKKYNDDIHSSVQICYKTNEPCKHNCQGLCKESC